MNVSILPEDAICFEQRTQWSRGVFFGDSPFRERSSLLLAQLTLCSLITTILHRLLNPLGQSHFISQILAGIVLGPSLLGKNAAFAGLFFPVSSFYIVDTFAFFGVMLFLFIIGVKTDLTLMKNSGRRSLVIGVSAFTVPLLLNLTLSHVLTRTIPMEARFQASVKWIASFQAISSFHVIVCLLADLKLMNSELGRLAISSSMVTGICSWMWTTIVFTGKLGLSIKQHAFMLMLLFFFIMVSFAVFIFRPIVHWMIKRTVKPKSMKESHVNTIFIMVLASAVFGEYFGQHFLFGPMILGMVIPDGPPLGSALIDKLELFVTTIILPIFFVVTAARIDLSAISIWNFAIIEFLAFFAFVWKVISVMLPSLYCKMPSTDALYLGLVLSNQGIVEVLMLERAKSIDLIDKQSYSIMILTILFFTGILSPIIKFSYKPTKRYYTSRRMTIQHTDPDMELRILACLHHQEHTPSIINIFQISYPNPQNPICFYVLHLLDLAGRSAPMLIAHQPGTRLSNESEHIINALRFFEHENRGNAAVNPFTSFAPYASMHEDACSLAAENGISLMILLFHKHDLALNISDEEANAIRSVNQNIINESPCSVGILIDRGAMSCSASILSHSQEYRVAAVYFGGADDREALCYALRMVGHPIICLTLVRFSGDVETREDSEMVEEYRDVHLKKNKRCFYQEEMVKDSVGVVNVVRSMGGCFDLVIVGRRHEEDSLLLSGLRDWNEFPELGCVGDMFVSLDTDCKASVLVVQQALFGEVDSEISLGYAEPFGCDNSNVNRVWPSPR